VFTANGSAGTKLLSLNRDAPFQFVASYKEADKVPGHATAVGSYLVSVCRANSLLESERMCCFRLPCVFVSLTLFRSRESSPASTVRHRR
jgi:hypothetical protein